MLIPPEGFDGWKVTTIGDDIAWIKPHADGQVLRDQSRGRLFRRRAGNVVRVEPERDGHAARERDLHQRRADRRRRRLVGGDDQGAAGASHRLAGPVVDAGLRPQGGAPECALHRLGGRSARRSIRTGTARTACRSTRSSSAARRSDTIPLVVEARTWEEGVYKAATMGSETTAAATGAVGEVRRDPFAMLPFCGYHVGDYFAHWLAMGKAVAKPPKIFNVNWFRTDDNGKFVWPGFGQNMRVLAWIVERCRGRGGARETALGRARLPRPQLGRARLPAGTICAGDAGRRCARGRASSRRTTSSSRSSGRSSRRRSPPSARSWGRACRGKHSHRWIAVRRGVGAAVRIAKRLAMLTY